MMGVGMIIGYVAGFLSCLLALCAGMIWRGARSIRRGY